LNFDRYCLDHKPNVRKEKERICRAGGRVTQHVDDVPRVQDLLAVSRALGDYSIDKQLIPASPDILEYAKDDKSKAAYVILACDGLWDVMSNEEVASFVVKRVTNTSLEGIVSQLLDHALQLETMDNVSIYIIKL
jgi:serine/threonine protein phosphatase PrpC